MEVDYYLSTWDITQDRFSTDVTSSADDIDLIKSIINFKEILIHSYRDFVNNYPGHILSRILFLYDKAYNLIKDMGYERVILIRPDLYLHPIDTIYENDFYIDDKSLLLVHWGEPITWLNKDGMGDFFMCVSWNTFKQIKNYFSTVQTIDPGVSTHKVWLDFFRDLSINVVLFEKYRSTVVRKEAITIRDKNDINYKSLNFIFRYAKYKNKNLNR
jgi:hypothetical protein